MKKYIYYPSFEPMNEKWLRFSLLYMDKIENIVPQRARVCLTRDFKMIQNESELVDLIEPSMEQAGKATIKAVVEIKKILSNPLLFGRIFKFNNYLSTWKEPRFQKFTIYSEKYTYEWAAFCLKNNLGHRDDEGNIVVHNTVAYIYMSLLAKEIGRDRGSSLITDIRTYDKYMDLEDRSKENEEEVKKYEYVKGLLKFNIPQNIQEIDIKKLLEFRKDNIKNIYAFNATLDKLESSVIEAKNINSAAKDFMEVHKEVESKLIENAGSLIFGGFLAVLAVVSGDASAFFPALGASYVGVGGKEGILKAFSGYKDKRECKKYFISIKDFNKKYGNQ